MGERAAPGIQSRFVTLEITEVLAGVSPRAPSMLVEEEGWTEDGALLEVDGLAPAQVGDDGIWFLLDGRDPQVGAYLVVNAQGRYLNGAGPTLSGAAGDDPLVRDLSARTPDDLRADVRRLGGGG